MKHSALRLLKVNLVVISTHRLACSNSRIFGWDSYKWADARRMLSCVLSPNLIFPSVNSIIYTDTINTSQFGTWLKMNPSIYIRIFARCHRSTKSSYCSLVSSLLCGITENRKLISGEVVDIFSSPKDPVCLCNPATLLSIVYQICPPGVRSTGPWSKRLTSHLAPRLKKELELWSKSKGKVHPKTGHKGPEGEQMYSSTLPSTSTVDVVGGQRHAPAALPPGKTRYPVYRRLGGTQGRSGQVRKISPPPGIVPRTFQYVTNRYTDWPIELESYLHKKTWQL
jgi:hypothetical protein